MPVRAWLFAIARNQLHDEFERRRRVELWPVEEVIDKAAVAPGRHELRALDWLGDSPAGVAFACLSEAQRQALTLRFVVGLNGPETAAVMGTTPAAVRQLQSRAFAFMQERMTALGYVPPASKGQRTWMRMRMRPLPVLRERRFALWSPSAHNAFAR